MSKADRAPAWPIYRRLLGFAGPYRSLLLFALAGMLIEAAAGSAFMKLMEPVVDETFISKNAQLSMLLPLTIVGLFVVRGIAGYITDVCMGRSARSIARDLRVLVLGKYLRLPGLRFDSEPVPGMLMRLGSDSDQVANAAVDAAKVMLAAVAADHRCAGGDAVDQLAGDDRDLHHGAAAGAADGQGRETLSPFQPSRAGKRRASAAGGGPDPEQSAGSEDLRRAGGRAVALCRAGRRESAPGDEGGIHAQHFLGGGAADGLRSGWRCCCSSPGAKRRPGG